MPLSDYELQRKANKASNERIINALEQVKVGKIVHIPHAVFPDEPMPPNGFWVGKLCHTHLGGMGDIGVHVDGEEIFTRSRVEVSGWLVEK